MAPTPGPQARRISQTRLVCCNRSAVLGTCGYKSSQVVTKMPRRVSVSRISATVPSRTQSSPKVSHGSSRLSRLLSSGSNKIGLQGSQVLRNSSGIAGGGQKADSSLPDENERLGDLELEMSMLDGTWNIRRVVWTKSKIAFTTRKLEHLKLFLYVKS